MGAQAVRLSNVDIDNALKNKDFEVLFQPIFDLGNGALARVETFIRWRHPSLGVLPPGAFISFFETQGRMSELTRYVLAEALNAYQDWRGSHAPGFSINLALSDLSDESFASRLTVLLRERGFAPELVTLECPMPPVDADTASTARQLQRLAETGARLAIEVRGRANDFLRTVDPFPFAEIKTGGAAILRFARTVRGPGLSAISELLELAQKHNAAITAVGVEDQASLAALRGLGFAAAQGNHLGRVGDLKHFMPSHVNDVRALLGLEPFSRDDLSALFRTGGPKLAPSAASGPLDAVADNAPAADAEAAPALRDVAPQISDDLVERLAARIARADQETPVAKKRGAAPNPSEKDAAIARARRKSLIREKLASRNALKEKAEARGEQVTPAREMQERLSREFESFSDDLAEPAEIDAEAMPIDPQTGQDDDPQDFADQVPDARKAPTMTSTGAAARPVQHPDHTESHMTISGATARFTATLRVGGPEPRAGHDFGDLHALEASEVEEIAPPAQTVARAAATRPSARPAAPALAPAQADAMETEIPAVAASAKWVEDTVAVEAQETPVPTRARKSFLTRTLIPYSALKVTHFWPRFIRTRMKAAQAAKTEDAA